MRNSEIFLFTLYWTLVLYMPSFILCGTYAFFNLSLPPRRPQRPGYRRRSSTAASSGAFRRNGTDSESIPLRRYERQSLAADVTAQSQLRLPSRSPAKQNERRSRLAFAVLVFMMFAAFAVGGAVVGSVILGYVTAGLFKAAKYNMST